MPILIGSVVGAQKIVMDSPTNINLASIFAFQIILLCIINKVNLRMNLEAEKLNLLQQIITTNDLGLINDIKGLLNNRHLDWFNGLSKSQQKDVEIGLSQLDNGNFLTHDEVKKKFGV